MQAAQTKAARELQLLFARLDLARLERRQVDLRNESAAWMRSMPLPGQTDLQRIARAEECSLKAFLLEGEITPLKLTIRNLESQLKSAPAQVASEVTAEMCAAQDDTMNFRAEVLA